MKLKKFHKIKMMVGLQVILVKIVKISSRIKMNSKKLIQNQMVSQIVKLTLEVNKMDLMIMVMNLRMRLLKKKKLKEKRKRRSMIKTEDLQTMKILLIYLTKMLKKQLKIKKRNSINQRKRELFQTLKVHRKDFWQTRINLQYLIKKRNRENLHSKKERALRQILIQQEIEVEVVDLEEETEAVDL